MVGPLRSLPEGLRRASGMRLETLCNPRNLQLGTESPCPMFIAEGHCKCKGMATEQRPSAERSFQ